MLTRAFCTRVLTLRIEKALRRFRKASNAVGHLRILRNKKTFESSHEKQKRKDKNKPNSPVHLS